MNLALSQGLFSSRDIDAGSRFLLQVLSKQIDADLATGRPPGRRILDAGSGCGVLGIAAWRALDALGVEPRLVAEDRDALAAAFSAYNGQHNGIPHSAMDSRVERLLAPFRADQEEPPGESYGLILSNVPAKAGRPVLEDLISRSFRALSPGGRFLMVAVRELEELFRRRFQALGIPLLRDEGRGGYHVFGYEKGKTLVPVDQDGDPYLRREGAYELEGICYSLRTLQGAAGFDSPGDAVLAAAHLCTKSLRPESLPPGPLLFHEAGQGHFPLWLLRAFPTLSRNALSLSGRNIIELEAAEQNLSGIVSDIRVMPAVDVSGDPPPGAPFALAALFPHIVPETRTLIPYWKGLERCLLPDSRALITLPSSQGESFDRAKPPSFTRLGQLRRHGFRSMLYRYRD